MTADLIGDREKLAERDRRIREVIVAVARWLVVYGGDVPHEVIRVACPADVPALVRDSCFADLMQVVSEQGPDRTDLPWDGQVALNYMTGEWT